MIAKRTRAARDTASESEVVLYADGDVVVAFAGSADIAGRVEPEQLRVLAERAL